MDYQYTVLALVRRKEKCLLVKHKGPQETSWWLPGGVVEAGEELISAQWKEIKDVLDLLSVHFWYDCEPLRRYLSGEVGEGIVYTQKIAGNQ